MTGRHVRWGGSAAAIIALVCSCSGGPDPRPAAAYPPVANDGDAVFFVGNSFFDWQGRALPQWVAALGASLSPPTHLDVGGDIVPGEAPLADFLGHAALNEALASGEYDVFVVQGYELEPVDDKADFHASVRELDRRVRAAGGRTVLFMTWDFHFRPFIDELAASYDEIGRELAVPVIPAGLVHADCGRSPPHGEPRHWLTADAEHPEGDLHQNAAGTAVNAYATLAVLTGRNPRGTNFTAPGNTNDDATMQYLSDMAWARVAPRLEGAR
ncbi:MAG TPA: hypothetical protein VFG69_13425 [Nannocystaceae bacterium]|nr:hypothetical protein [Nannocystaceae bacterium]